MQHGPTKHEIYITTRGIVLGKKGVRHACTFMHTVVKLSRSVTHIETHSKGQQWSPGLGKSKNLKVMKRRGTLHVRVGVFEHLRETERFIYASRKDKVTA